MKYATAIAHIRQLCCLGLGGEVVMPKVLGALHDLVPADSNGFFWVDDDYEIANMCAERMLPPEVMGLYFREFYNQREGGFKSGFAERARDEKAITRASFSESFYRTDYYNQIWRNLNAHFAMYALIRERGKCFGQLSVYRAPKEQPFSDKDERQLASITRYVAHALKPGRDAGRADYIYRDSEYNGLIIFAQDGQLQHMSPQGRRLLFLASHPHISRRAIAATPTDAVPQALVRLCTDLRRIFGGGEAPPPVLEVDNAWGRFVFRAYWMEHGEAGANGVIGVLVQHQEPLALKLLGRMRSMPLSVKQKEVILGLAGGIAHGQIAQRMNVSLNTVNYHIKQVYDKLDVHDRNGMLSRLLA